MSLGRQLVLLREVPVNLLSPFILFFSIIWATPGCEMIKKVFASRDSVAIKPIQEMKIRGMDESLTLSSRVQ